MRCFLCGGATHGSNKVCDKCNTDAIFGISAEDCNPLNTPTPTPSLEQQAQAYVLPDWMDVSNKEDNDDQLNPIERFLYEWEPAGEGDNKKFRAELQALVNHLAASTRYQQEVQELKDQNETLRRQNNAYKNFKDAAERIQAHQSKLLSEAKTVDSEREANELLTNEIEQLKARIAELEGIANDQSKSPEGKLQEILKLLNHG